MGPRISLQSLRYPPQETSSPLIPLQDHHTLLTEESEAAGFFLLSASGVSGKENAYSEGLDY